MSITSARIRTALLVLLVLNVTVLFLLAWRSEKQDHKLDQDTYVMCSARNKNVDRLNKFNRGMIRIEQHNPFSHTSPETVTNRIQLYRSALLKHVSCGPNPE